MTWLRRFFRNKQMEERLEKELRFHVQQQTDWSTQWGNLWAYTYPNFVDCKRESRSLDMAAWRFSGGTISEPGEAEYVDGREVSSELFPLLGITLRLGRGFQHEEDRIG